MADHDFADKGLCFHCKNALVFFMEVKIPGQPIVAMDPGGRPVMSGMSTSETHTGYGVLCHSNVPMNPQGKILACSRFKESGMIELYGEKPTEEEKRDSALIIN